MRFIYLKSALKCDSFDVAIGIKFPFFRVLVTIEPGRYHELFERQLKGIIFLVIRYAWRIRN